MEIKLSLRGFADQYGLSKTNVTRVYNDELGYKGLQVDESRWADLERHFEVGPYAPTEVVSGEIVEFKTKFQDSSDLHRDEFALATFDVGLDLVPTYSSESLSALAQNLNEATRQLNDQQQRLLNDLKRQQALKQSLQQAFDQLKEAQMRTQIMTEFRNVMASGTNAEVANLLEQLKKHGEIQQDGGND